MADLSRNIVRYETKDGVTLDVSPLSGITQALIMQRSTTMIPDPPVPLKPLPHAAVEGDTFPDYDDEAYQQGVAEAKVRRKLYVQAAIYAAACRPGSNNGTGQGEIIELYAPLLEQIAPYVDLYDDVWLNTLLHGALRDPEDARNVQKIVDSQAVDQITMEGIEQKLRIFRFSSGRSDDHAEDGSPGAA